MSLEGAGCNPPVETFKRGLQESSGVPEELPVQDRAATQSGAQELQSQSVQPAVPGCPAAVTAEYLVRIPHLHIVSVNPIPPLEYRTW